MAGEPANERHKLFELRIAQVRVKNLEELKEARQRVQCLEAELLLPVCETNIWFEMFC